MADAGGGSRGITSPYAVLAVLSLINLLNYIDRTVLAGVVPALQKPVADGGLALTNTQVGLLTAAFMIVHSLASIPLGVAADRVMRTRLIAFGVGLWSLATAVAGFARSFGQLFAMRAAVGIGEAAYAPAATALISERFPEASRGRALGVFQAGMLLGGALGIMLGSVVGGQWGWRAAFFVVGGPGLLLMFAAFAIHERPRAHDASASMIASRVDRRAMLDEIKTVLRARGVWWVYAAGILITFTVGAFLQWGLAFVVRYFYANDPAMSARVGLAFGPLVVGAGIVGVVVGSVLGDRLEQRWPGRGRMTIVGAGPLLGAPFIALGLWTPSLGLMYVCIGFGTAFSSFYVGPVLAALHDIVGPRARATATGAYFFLVHLLGDAISPPIVGWVADRTGSLRVGMSVAAGAAVLGGAAALIGVRAATRGGPRGLAPRKLGTAPPPAPTPG